MLLPAFNLCLKMPNTEVFFNFLFLGHQMQCMDVSILILTLFSKSSS